MSIRYESISLSISKWTGGIKNELRRVGKDGFLPEPPTNMKFCPCCAYFLFLNAFSDDGGAGETFYKCRNCGYEEKLEPKTKDEALILETTFRTGSSAAGAASGITINAYTLMDPTLPHRQDIRCPNGSCPSRADESLRDVIYIKTDPVNLKFQYICTVCKQQWSS
jgi:DNA-directed RNA polymerase subunit M/transcription elongation factor TFIIS